MDQALQAQDGPSVIRFADAIIARNRASFETPMQANWAHARALFERGTARADAGDPKGFDDMIAAADLGDLGAAEAVSEVYLTHRPLPGSSEPTPLDPIVLSRMLRMRAELGDYAGAHALVAQFSAWPDILPAAEGLYWEMIVASDPAQHNTQLRDAIIETALSGDGAHQRQILGYALVPLAPANSIPNLPPRGPRSLLFADEMLRGQHGLGFQQIMDRTQGPPETDVRVMFLRERQVANLIGMSDLYLIGVDDRGGAGASTLTSSDPTTLFATRDQTMALMSPSDHVILRCGPLSHATYLYRIDRAQGLVFFTDPLLDFWRPSHNTCVSHFDVRDERYGRTLVAVPMREVRAMVQAIFTFRDLAGDAPRH